MKRNTTSVIVTTACIGAAVGAAAYMMSGNHSANINTRKIKRSTGKALRQVGDFIGNVSYMMR